MSLQCLKCLPRLLLAALCLTVLFPCSGLLAQDSEKAYSPDSLPMEVGQEPLIFRLRRGTAATDDAERWARAHTEENIRKIAESGEKFFYTHFYKGFGFQAEKEEMDLTVKTAAWARKYGMQAGVYFQWGSVVWETFLQENPRAKDWVLLDRDGHPVRINYGHYYWRYLPDLRNPEYMHWYKETVLRYCVEKVKPRYIFLDNVAENPPVSWQPLHNRYWVEGFRDYLRTNYTAEQRKEMLGYSSVDYVLPPYWEWENDKVVNDPIMQRWIDFRCKSVTDAVAETCRFIKSLDSTIAVGVNIHEISRENRAITGIDPVAVCNRTGVDAWSGEIWDEAELTPEGVLISPIREYKACRTLKVAFQSGGRGPLGRAVKMAFSYRLRIPGGGYLGAPGRAQRRRAALLPFPGLQLIRPPGQHNRFRADPDPGQGAFRYHFRGKPQGPLEIQGAGAGQHRVHGRQRDRGGPRLCPKRRRSGGYRLGLALQPVAASQAGVRPGGCAGPDPRGGPEDF